MNCLKSSNPNERRLRIINIAEGHVLAVFAACAHQLDFLQLPLIEGCPDGYEVLSVHYRFLNKCFAFTIRHPSFSEVEEGCHIPDLKVTCRITLERHGNDEAHPVYVPVREGEVNDDF